ncbi:oocyte-secreted protein 3-like [Monodelphis domestica]|uniref:oocyte-secreted protein 3-like n=1 Tax=Monodelphis domestica TaxID=13616 RepID=UPI000443373F|nr:oocyte-secreted protein 3-like [Monodelphis domestica]
MEAFLRLVLLCLLICLSWADDEPVTVDCNLLMFRVSVKKNLFGACSSLKAEELILGTGCRVNGEKPNIFELHYSVTECGIQFEAFETHVIYKSKLYYTPVCAMFGHASCEFPLTCTVFRTTSSRKMEEEPVANLPSRDHKESRALRMQASEYGPIHWSRELCGILGRSGKMFSSEQKTDSWSRFFVPAFTLSSVLCHLFCHGDFVPTAS